jgi:protoporphyrinogen oxidase
LNQSKKSEILILGAGPAGLTAGWELSRNGKKVIVLESDPKFVGGIARTASFNEFRFDIGGHRFFTKSTEVQKIWTEILDEENWLRDVPRLSRIYFNRKFFAYPLKPIDAVFKLGLFKSISLILSYLRYKVFPIKSVVSFEDWVINNFGKKLFLIFFKTYTEKVWGIPCSEISADWAAQRIKGLSLSKAIISSLFSGLTPKAKSKSIKTLIDKFDYPKLGPGMVWEEAAKKINNSSQSEVILSSRVTCLRLENKNIVSCEVNNNSDGYFETKQVISTLPIRDLINIISPKPPKDVIDNANNLKYRDFLTVVLILNVKDIFPDNWIYIHEPNVKLGRIQNFKNWSPKMVPDSNMTSLGLEYFCNEGDDLWTLSDKALIELGIKELFEIDLIKPEWFVDGTVLRMPKAYPVYDASYRAQLRIIRSWLDENIQNLQLVGRNGMHMYNNQDHSMLAAHLAARNLLGESWDPWKVNADAEYHEEALVQPSGRMVPRKISDQR